MSNSSGIGFSTSTDLEITSVYVDGMAPRNGNLQSLHCGLHVVVGEVGRRR